MKEYRIFNMTEEQSDAFFEDGYTVIEEDFKGESKFHTIYAEEDFADVLNNNGLEFEVKDVESTGWEDKWKDYLKPGWLTDKIYFCFDNEEFDDGRKVLRINPALAFGTGTHSTTQAAARLLCPISDGKTVIDAGCGSGILAIAAYLSGAKRVYAFDIDAVALGNTVENIRMNNCENVYAWSGGSDSIGLVDPDVYCANIITSVLKIVHPDALQQKPEYIVYSGILVEEYEEFMDSIDLSDYEVEDRVVINEWTGVRLKRCMQ